MVVVVVPKQINNPIRFLLIHFQENIESKDRAFDDFDEIISEDHEVCIFLHLLSI